MADRAGGGSIGHPPPSRRPRRGGPGGRRRWRLPAALGGAGALVLVLVAALALEGRTRPAGEDPPPREGSQGVPDAPADPAGTTQLQLGVTHVQYSADEWGDPAAVRRAEEYLAAGDFIQNQHIMGFGAENPEPAPGAFDFASLDRRMELIRSTGGTPVITLCCAPDWMKGGEPGRTDWDRLEVAPDPEHYGDFANLAAEVALRYPWVEHFIVWNELKGFWDDDLQRWDHEGYTDLYNQVYDALKRVNPEIRVGGPYPVMNSWASPPRVAGSAVRGPWGTIDQRDLDAVTYWLEHSHGADFLVVDGQTGTRDGGLVTDPFTATGKFAAVSEYLGRQTDLPLWWAEWYVNDPEAPPSWSQEQWVAVRTAALIRMSAGGSAVALLWEPEEHTACDGCLWSSTREPSGGRRQPFADVFERFGQAFPPGTPLVDVHASDPAVLSMASAADAVLVNTTDAERAVTFDGAEITLAGYGVAWVDRG